MAKDVFTYIIGGKAGQGIKKAGDVAAHLFAEMGRNVFHMIDYPSLIRGGHNFSVVSTSTTDIQSHYMNADLVVALDEQSFKVHKNHVNDTGIIVVNAKEQNKYSIGIDISSESKQYDNADLIEGVAGIAILAAKIDIDKKRLDALIKQEYGSNLKDNKSFAHTIYDMAIKKIKDKTHLKNGKKKKKILSGNDLIGLGAAAAGLDLYFAYPMTPSTSILHFFAKNGEKLGISSVQPENEIAVANMAIGSCFTGARSMVGTSGGGFCLMQEAFSLAGMIEAPILFCVGQRPGPSTGVPTYTEQGELLFSLYPGQGEFPRIVASPGNLEESFYLTSELMNLVWQFQTPGILLTEKHLAESSMTIDLKPYNTSWVKPKKSMSKEYQRYRITETGVSSLRFPPSDQTIKWNSYEHLQDGSTTEDPTWITKMHVKRLSKHHSLIDYLKRNVKTVNIFGNGSPNIFTFGSTTMSVLEALDHANIDATVIQPIYLQPFPVWDLEKFRGKKGHVVEQNCSGQLEMLLEDKINLKPLLSIRKYNGRPFNPIELGKKFKKVL